MISLKKRIVLCSIWSFFLFGFVLQTFISCKKKQQNDNVVVAEKDYIIEGSCGEDAEYILYTNGTLKIYGKGAMDDYDYRFEKKAEIKVVPWIEYRDRIKKLDIQGISTIGSYAFDSLLFVKEVVVPSSVKSVHKSAFACMEQLEAITFQGDLDYIGEYAIAVCKSLLYIKFEGEVKALGSSCFQENKNIEVLTIPDGIEHLPSSVCSFCDKLRKIILPKTLKVLDAAFYYCPSLEEVKLPESLKQIDLATFINDPKIESIVIPKSVSRIKNLDASKELKTICILSETMPEIDCTSSIYYGVSFQLYVPSHLLSDYKSHEKLQYLAEQIHSLSFSSDSNSYTTNDDYYPSNGSYENQDMNNGPYRPECRACRGKGDCFVCKGRGYTHTKRVYNNSLGCWDLVDEPCHSCGNTGKCTACKGDGFLDEGIDY